MSKATVLPILPPEAPDPALERDTEELYDALSDLVRVYQFRDRDRICCFDVSVSQCYALEALVRRGGDDAERPRGAALPRQEHGEPGGGRPGAQGVRGPPAASGGPPGRAPRGDHGRPRALEEKIRESILAEERQLLAGFAPEVRQAMTQLLRQLARGRRDGRGRRRKLLPDPLSAFFLTI